MTGEGGLRCWLRLRWSRLRRAATMNVSRRGRLFVAPTAFADPSFHAAFPFTPSSLSPPPPCLGARRPASTYRLIALLRRFLTAPLRVSKDPFKLCSLHYFCKTTSTTTQLHSRFRPPFLPKGGYGHGGPYKSRCNTAISVTCC